MDAKGKEVKPKTDEEKLKEQQLLADAEALLKGAKETEEKDKGAKGDDLQTAGEHEETHEEKSKAGRKIKRLETTIARLEAKLDKALEGQTVARQENEDPEPDLSEIPTAAEVRAHNLWAGRQTQREARKEASKGNEQLKSYQKEYTQLIYDMVDQDEDPELYALLTQRNNDGTGTQFNIKLSEDPKLDVLTNYRNAVAHLSGTKKEKGANVRGKDTEVARGVNKGKTKIDESAGAEVDMSKWSIEEQQAAKLFSKEELKQMKAEGRL
jgi:hypothetical protein